MFDIRKIQEQVIFQAVKGAKNENTAHEIVYGENKEGQNENNPTWVKNTMKRLEKCFDREELIGLRRSCQCGHAMDEKLALVNELVAASNSAEEFGNLDKARAAGLSYVNGAIHLEFPFCPCPMLAEVDRLETDTWCQCTTGYSKVLFEKAFGCEVEVELLQSVKMGHEKCLMKILPKDKVWAEK